MAGLNSDLDAIFVGSKPGAMSGEGASSTSDTPIIATSAAAVSSKALAVLRKSGAPVASISTRVGPVLAWWAPEESNHDGLRDATAETVNGLLEEIVGHEDRTFMAACYKAEAFMESWQEKRVRLVDPRLRILFIESLGLR